MQTGSLRVTISPQGAIDAGAQWRRVGTTTWLDSGYLESNVPVGSHTVEFKAVSGWNTPPNQSVTIYNGQTTNASGTYTIKSYTLTYNAGANGSISGTTPQTVDHGTSGTAVTAVPATGYRFVQWTKGGTFYSTSNPLTVTNVTENMTLDAVFEHENAAKGWQRYE